MWSTLPVECWGQPPLVPANRHKILRVPILGQRSSDCGPTSLKAVCWFHDRHVSVRKLAGLAGATRDGVDHGPLVRAARATGAAVFARAGGTLRELRRFLALGLPIIVGWWSQAPGEPHFDARWTLPERRRHDCGHYSVVCGLDRAHVWLMDPQWERRGRSLKIVGMRAIRRQDFLGIWYDTDTRRYLPVKRWYMVVHYDDRSFAAHVPGGKDYPRRRRVALGERKGGRWRTSRQSP